MTGLEFRGLFLVLAAIICIYGECVSTGPAVAALTGMMGVGLLLREENEEL